jgi:hypothetical protein
MRIRFWFGNYWGGLGLWKGHIKMGFKKLGVKLWTEFTWLNIGKSVPRSVISHNNACPGSNLGRETGYSGRVSS